MVGWRERSFALVSVACAVLLTVAVVVFCVRNLAFLVVALAGLALMVAGVWWIITERLPRRAFGLVGALAGAVLIVVAVIRAEPHGDRPGARARHHRCAPHRHGRIRSSGARP